eukprot:6213365-Pleurochrysis_carterae.AAC.2
MVSHGHRCRRMAVRHPAKRRSGTLARDAIICCLYREAVVKSCDAILMKLVYCGHTELSNSQV